jgi:hypothetical protein
MKINKDNYLKMNDTLFKALNNIKNKTNLKTYKEKTDLIDKL